MYVWLCWVFASARGPPLAVASGGHSSSRRAGLSPSRPLAAAHKLQTRRLSNRGSRAEPLRGTRDLPRPGLEPAFSALAGRFSTTAPPGKPQAAILNRVVRKSLIVQKHRLERGERMSFAGICGKSNPGRNSQCKGPEIEAAHFLFFFFFLIFIYLFIYGCVGSSFLCEGFL